MKSKYLLGSLLLATAAAIWGGMFVVVKSVVGEIPPVELVWLRYLVAIVCLLIFTLVRHEHWHFTKRDLGIIILIGIVGNTLSLVAQETGTWLSNAHIGAVVTTSTPIFMIIWAWMFLKERLSRIQIFSIILSALGVIVIVGIHLSGGHLLLGILSLLISSIAWAFASVLVKKLPPHYSALQITIVSIGVALVLLTPWIGFHWNVMANINFFSFKVIFSVLYLGCISTASAFMMWDKGLELMDADSSGLFYLIQPVVGALLGWLLLGETISAGFLVGMAMIIIGVFVYIKFDE